MLKLRINEIIYPSKKKFILCLCCPHSLFCEDFYCHASSRLNGDAGKVKVSYDNSRN